MVYIHGIIYFQGFYTIRNLDNAWEMPVLMRRMDVICSSIGWGDDTTAAREILRENITGKTDWRCSAIFEQKGKRTHCSTRRIKTGYTHPHIFV